MDGRASTRLPPETWTTIFHHATHVPGTLVPDIYDNASILGPIFVKTYHPAIRASLRTKRSLVRVCRQWWHLAVPFLYQSVYIGRTRYLPSLSTTLLRSAEGKGNIGSTPLGKYTRRLDIAIRDKTEDLDAEGNGLLKLIACMPHLTVFSVVATATFAHLELEDYILESLQSSAPSLRVFDWSSIYLKPAHIPIINFLDKCTQLRVLNCDRILVWSRDLQQCNIPPTVTTLHAHALSAMPWLSAQNHPTISNNVPVHARSPPVLQELIIDPPVIPHHSEYFLRLYSSQLVSVQLCIPNKPVVIYPFLQILLRTCPDLRRLTVASVNFSRITEPLPISPHTSITYLGLRVDRPQSSRPDFEALFRFMEQLRPSLPSLRVVQLLNERNLECLLKKHTKFAVRVLRPFMEPGVPFRLEDKDGVLLTDRLKVLGRL